MSAEEERSAFSFASVDIAQALILQNNLQLKKRVADSIGNRTTVCCDGESILSIIQKSRDENKPHTLQSQFNCAAPSNYGQGVMHDPRVSRNGLSFQPMVQGRSTLHPSLRPHAEFYDLAMYSPPFVKAEATH